MVDCTYLVPAAVGTPNLPVARSSRVTSPVAVHINFDAMVNG
jgi:hypothetical protein